MRIAFYTPQRAVSMTGFLCEQLCDHCGGKALRGMETPHNAGELFELAKNFEENILLSGGNDYKGRVPWERFEEAITAIKKEYGLKIAMHTGVIGRGEIERIRSLGVDQILLDFILDDVVLKRNYHAPYTSGDIMSMLHDLMDSGVEPVPHLLFGMESIESNRREIEVPSDMGIKKAILIFLVSNKKMDAESLRGFMRFARGEFDGVLAIRCMRGREKPQIDLGAVELGYDRIALPTLEARDLAIRMGYEIEERMGCCSFP